jgi:hypothetical protein
LQSCPTYALCSDFHGWEGTFSRSLLLVLNGNDGSCTNNAIWVLTFASASAISVSAIDRTAPVSDLS